MPALPRGQELLRSGDQLFTPRKHPSLLPSQIIYPLPDPSEHERSQVQQRLWQEDGVLKLSMLPTGHSLRSETSRVRPEMVVGHTGDFSLLLAASPDAPRVVMINAMAALEQSVHSTIRTYEQLRLRARFHRISSW
jgi:hypothetical protein